MGRKFSTSVVGVENRYNFAEERYVIATDKDV